LIRFEERDIFKNLSFKEELKEGNNSIKVPQLFINGKNFGVNFDL
jgi:glutaredoxin